MKDLAWLKGKVKVDIDNLWFTDRLNTKDTEVLIARINTLIDQLEPTPSNSTGLEEVNEKLFEQAWEESAGKHIIKLESVYDILSRLEQPELPVIPEFVAEYIEECKKLSYTLQEVYLGNTTHVDDKYKTEDVKKYILNDTHGLLDIAWVLGYTVEAKKYYVYLGDGQYLVSKDELTSQPVTIRHEEDKGFLNYKINFTEKEIKGYKGGIYWPFSREVKE